MIATFDPSKASEKSTKIKGLLLQGAALKNDLLHSSQGEEEFQALPILYIDFLQNPPPMHSKEEEMNVFSNFMRENVVFKLKLGISGDSADKIISGTALFLKEI